MDVNARPLAVITGASAGIGYELARICAENEFDLLIAADQPKIRDAAEEFGRLGAKVEAVEADLATLEGVDRLYEAAKGRPIKALLANAGHGLGKGFLDQDFKQVRHVIDTVGQMSKDDPAAVARTGFHAMMRGDGDVVAGWKNKVKTSLATVTPAGLLAEQHRKLAQPGYSRSNSSGVA